MKSIDLTIVPKLMSLPPSSIEIYSILHRKELESNNFSSSKQIANISNYSPRTVRYALKKLKAEDLVIKIHDLYDARRCYWIINPMIKDRFITR